MKRFLPILLCSLFLSGCSSGYQVIEQLGVIPIQQKLDSLSLQELQRLSGGNVEMIYAPNDIKVRQINGKFTYIPIFTVSDAVTALTSVADIMGIKDIEFAQYRETQVLSDRRVFTVIQLYHKIPVRGGVFQITASLDGAPLSVRGLYQDCSGTPTKPVISYTEAQQSFHLDQPDRIKKCEASIYMASQNEPYLSWVYTIDSKKLENQREIVVDAMTGNLLAVIPLIIN